MTHLAVAALLCSAWSAAQVPGPIELGEWKLSVHPDVGARLEGRVALRVIIDKFAADKGYQIHLRSSTIAVDPSLVYTFRFRARAPSPRPVEIALTKNGPPFDGLIPPKTLEIAGDWKEYGVTFSPAKPEEDASVQLNVGSSGTEVEFAAMTLEAVKKPVTSTSPAPDLDPIPPEPLRKWALTVNKESKAKLVTDPQSPDLIRVVIDEARCDESWQIGIRTLGLSFDAENEYTLTFWARAETWRKIDIVVSQARPPWKQVRWMTSVEVGPEWEEHSVAIRPLYTEHDAQIQFNLGLSDADVELRDFKITSVKQEPIGQQENRFDFDAWELEAKPDVKAVLEINPTESVIAVRIDANPSVVPESLVLSHGGLKLRAHRDYRLRFQAKAQANRTVRLSIVDGSQPPRLMGFDRIITVGPTWEEFGLMFTPGRTHTECKLHFLLGESEADVELAEVALEYVPVTRVEVDRERSFWINAIGVTVTVSILGILVVRDILKRRSPSSQSRAGHAR